MKTRRRRQRRTERGMTLLEAMIALAVLLIGLLGTAQLQMYGMGATQGARAQTIATELATELAGSLSQLPTNDARISGAAGADAVTPPATFGRLLPLGVPTSGVHTWSDASAVPGARLDSTLERDPEHPTEPIYHRRWTVWDLASTPTGDVSSKLIAVSVIFRERTVAKPHEVVVLASAQIRGAFMSNLGGGVR